MRFRRYLGSISVEPEERLPREINETSDPISGIDRLADGRQSRA